MEIHDRERVERLERVRRKQREFQEASICKGLVEEIILDSIMWQGWQICKDLVEGVVMHDSWEIMEMNSIITEIRKGGGESSRRPFQG